LQPFLTNIIIKTILTSILLGGYVFDPSPIDAKDLYQNTQQTDSTDSNKIKSPRKAMICSLVIPGLGQLYNGSLLKGIMFFGAEVGLLTNSIYLNQKFKESTDDYVREFYIENRNISTWWLVGVKLLSILDAYVDAHLYNFDESPNLNFYFAPSITDKKILFSVVVTF